MFCNEKMKKKKKKKRSLSLNWSRKGKMLGLKH